LLRFNPVFTETTDTEICACTDSNISSLLSKQRNYSPGLLIFQPFAIMHDESTTKTKKPLENQGAKFVLAVRTGLEPATLCVTGRYSNQLNYRTKKTSLSLAKAVANIAQTLIRQRAGKKNQNIF